MMWPLGFVASLLAMTNQPSSASSSTSRQKEHFGIVDQHLAIGLHRVGVRLLGGATREKILTGGAFERPQERFEAGGFHPLHDSRHAVEGIDVGRLPNFERGASRNKSRVETFDCLVEGSRFGDREELFRPGSIGGEHPHEHAVRLMQIVRQLNREKPPSSTARAVSAKRGANTANSATSGSKDQVEWLGWVPTANVGFVKLNIWQARFSLFEHLSRIVDPDNLRVAKAPRQQGGGVTRSAAEIGDFTGF